jgi:hypothetical protein
VNRFLHYFSYLTHMAKQHAFSKRQIERQKRAKRKEKEKRREARKDAPKDTFEDMLAYVDEYGVIHDTPPQEEEEGTKQEETPDTPSPTP